MTQSEFIDRIKLVYLDNIETCKAKNTDYAGGDDAFKNFKASEMYGVLTEQAILVRMSDKMTRISNLLKSKPKVLDESLLDSLKDLANYSAILHVYMEYEKTKS